MIKVNTRRELEYLIDKTIRDKGPRCDLNFIDVSLITDMNSMFYNSDFNGNISKWNVSNVTDMSWMFAMSKFNGDISRWNVSNVTNMISMFNYSEFNRNISRWDISNVTNMSHIFHNSNFKQNLSKWRRYCNNTQLEHIKIFINIKTYIEYD